MPLVRANSEPMYYYMHTHMNLRKQTRCRSASTPCWDTHTSPLLSLSLSLSRSLCVYVCVICRLRTLLLLAMSSKSVKLEQQRYICCVTLVQYTRIHHTESHSNPACQVHLGGSSPRRATCPTRGPWISLCAPPPSLRQGGRRAG